MKHAIATKASIRWVARREGRSRVLGVLLAATVMMSLAALPVRAQEENADPEPPQLIPAPVSMETTVEVYSFRANSKVTVDPGHAGRRALPVAQWLASFLRTATGYPVPVARQGWGRQNKKASPGNSPRNVHLALTGDEAQLGEEGYTLSVSDDGAVLQAATAEGLFRGSQTLRQLFPPEIENDSVQPGPWTLPGVNIADYPRYEWRGAHLDVARHFLTVEEVKRYIDLLTLYKINRFHMHLSDDQGWRLWIDDWPNLALIGGSTEVGGGPGGYYTKAEYGEIVQYAADRFITLIPEIDVPGHTNAAEVSYPELNSCRPGGVPSHRLLPGWEDEPFYTGTGVGFSALCVNDEITYEFMADVIREISEITPGPYFHVGGDEAFQTSLPDYIMFMDRIQDMVHDNGKTMMGWAEVARANAVPGSIAQHWSTATGGGSGGDLARTAVAKDMKVVMSPANRVYLDMKYAPGVPPDLGLTWAGTVEVMRSYDWNPGAHLTGVTDDNIIGVEAPLWTETIEDIKDAEMMSFPRLPGVGEIGWTPQQGRVWTEYRERLANQARRWAVMDINYYRSPQVDWVD
ncbi:MAG: beta-N-acetylhexosaminidase [Actinomycetota bacterium]